MSRYPDPFDPEDGYPFLEMAAAEARGMSRRWWAKGGAADRRFPVHPDVDRVWPLRGRAEFAPTKNNKAWIKRRQEKE